MTFLKSNPLSLLLFSLFLSFVFPPISLAAVEAEPYHIGPEDVLDISVWQSPDLTKTVTVTPKGTISYPFLGELAVSNQTTQEVEQLLREKLSQGYLKDPQVSVTVKEYNSKKILVFGDVIQPGLYKIKSKIPLLEVLFLVKGVKPEAKRMTIIRSTASPDATAGALSKRRDASAARAIDVNLILLLSRGDLSQNIMIQPGDTIYVSSGTDQKYYVLGQVNKPGPYDWVQDITVLEAIKLADGATKTAALNRIMIRKNHSKEEVIKVNVVDIMKGKKKDDVVIKPGDVVIVPESWI